jgi:hypothetical protein
VISSFQIGSIKRSTTRTRERHDDVKLPPDFFCEFFPSAMGAVEAASRL